MSYVLKRAAVQLRKFKPEVIAQVLNDIAAKHGGITPKAVVDEARDAQHPLHEYFEWNDSFAGERWRQHQAAYLIRGVVIVDEQAQLEQVPAFVNVRDDDESGDADKAGVYMPTMDVMKEPVLRQQVLTRALRDFHAWRRRYQTLDELAPIFDAGQKAQLSLGLIETDAPAEHPPA